MKARDKVANELVDAAVTAVRTQERTPDAAILALLDAFMFSGIPEGEWSSVIVDAASRIDPDSFPPDDRDAATLARQMLRDLAQKVWTQRNGPDGYS